MDTFNCTPVGRASDGQDLKLFILVGWRRSFLSVAWPTWGSTGVSLLPRTFSKLLVAQGSPSSDSLLNLCPRFLFHHGGYHNLFVCPL